MQKFIIDTRAKGWAKRLSKLIRMLPKGRYTITVSTSGDRHIGRNFQGYYFKAILEPISEYTGYTKEELHSMFMEKYAFKFSKVGGKYMFRRKSLNEMSNRQMSHYIESIKEFVRHELPEVKLPE